MKKILLFLGSLLLLSSCSVQQNMVASGHVLDVVVLQKSTGYDIEGPGTSTPVYYLALEFDEPLDLTPAEDREAFLPEYDYYRFSDSGKFYIEQTSGELKELSMGSGRFSEDLESMIYDMTFEEGELVSLTQRLPE